MKHNWQSDRAFPLNYRLAIRARVPMKLLLALAGGVAAIGGLLFFTSGKGANAEGRVPIIMATVSRGPFLHEVWERGEIESSSNVEVRCEVRAGGNGNGINIIEIVPEGKLVKKGDFLVRLDDAALRTDMIQQEIMAANSQSAVIEAQADLDAARLALEEYEEGTFLQDEEQSVSEVFVAQENVRRAEEYLGYSNQMSRRGYVSEVQLEADRFALEKARKELEVAETKLRVLRTYTKEKTVTQLRAAIDSAEARLKARQKNWDLDKVRLAEITEQVAKCLIHAPADGQVVYANTGNQQRGSNGEVPIAEGRPVRERQAIIRLPDPTRMRVMTNVHESRISNLRAGMEAKIVLDAFPDRRLNGQVAAISEFPLPSVSIYTTHIKEYLVEVEIDAPPAGLRPGMSAQVNVQVEHIADANQVPVNAVVERAGRFFCAIPQAHGKFETREIKVGSFNQETIVILDGLQLGESVVISPLQVEKKLHLPEPLRDMGDKPAEVNAQPAEAGKAATT